MKLLPLASLLALAALFAPGTVSVCRADEPIGFEQGESLMAKYRCQPCHAVDQTSSAGPSLRDIAKRHAADPHAQSELEQRIVNGSLGAWGPTPMAPVQVPHADLRKLVRWILSLKQT
ncbi:MAG TPA: c-type cytochrome [Steroidobacteraceae bacterium]|nr:c-type cytochrome [Steroidobacteraceae bacterium]